MPFDQPVFQTGAALVNPLLNLWFRFVEFFPWFILAIILLIIGYLISYVLGHAVRIILQKLGLDKQFEKAHLIKAVGKFQPSIFFGEITKWAIFLVFFLPQIADTLRLGTLSILLRDFASWIPNVLYAAIIVVLGLLVVNYVVDWLEEHSKTKGSKFTASVIKVVLMLLVILVALRQIGIDVTLIEQTFLILLAGAALALGLAFGLGSRKEVENLMKSMKKYF